MNNSGGHIFISYAVADAQKFAVRIYDDLTQAHHAVWLDKHSIRDGFDWDREIDQGLRNARALVVALTPGAVLSHQVRSEWNSALNSFTPIIPLLVVTCEVPRALSLLNYIDFRHDYDLAFQKLRYALDNLNATYVSHLEGLLASFLDAQQTTDRPENFQPKIDSLKAVIARLGAGAESPDETPALSVDLAEEQQRLVQLSRLRTSSDQRRSVGTRLIDVGLQFRDRKQQFAQLMAYLADPQSRLISVIGRGGIGKTGLVSKLLRELETRPDQLPESVFTGIVYLSTRTTGVNLERIFLSSAELLGSERGAALNAVWTDTKRTLEDKIQELLRILSDGLYIILCDNMEDLLDDQQQIIDADLRLFFEYALKTSTQVRLLVTSRAPITLSSEALRFDRHVLVTEGLPVPDAVAMLRDLDPNGTLGLRDAADAELEEVAALTRGVPRALEVFASILANDPFLTLTDLMKRDDLFHNEQFVNQLVRENFRRLDPDALSVLQAVCVFTRPVPLVAVEYVLTSLGLALDVAAIVRRLANAHSLTIDRQTKTVTLHPIDRDYLYSQLPESGDHSRQKFERYAAEYFRHLQLPKQEWKLLEDLDPHLTSFEHFVRASHFRDAAEILQAIGEFPLVHWGYARRALDMTEMILSHVDDPSLRMSLLTIVGEACMHLGVYERGLAARKELLAIAESTADPHAIAHALQKVGHAYANLSRYQEAIQYQQEALTLARTSGDQNSEWDALRILGMAYRNLGSPTEAVTYFEQAMTIATALADTRKEGMILESLAVVYRNIGRIDDSIKLLLRALELAQAVGAAKEEAKALGNLGAAYAAKGEWAEAIRFSRKTIALCDEIGYPRQAGYAYEILGLVALGQGDPETAQKHFEMSLQVHKQISNRLGQSQALSGLAETFQRLNQPDRAEVTYQEAVNAARDLRNAREEARLTGKLGDLYLALNRIAAARESYNSALRLWEDIREPAEVGALEAKLQNLSQ